jgi:hypothetical protein
VTRWGRRYVPVGRRLSKLPALREKLAVLTPALDTGSALMMRKGHMYYRYLRTLLMLSAVALVAVTVPSCGTGKGRGSSADHTAGTAQQYADSADIAKIVSRVEKLLGPGGSLSPAEEQFVLASWGGLELWELHEVFEVFQEGLESTGTKGFRVTSFTVAPVKLGDSTGELLSSLSSGIPLPFSMALKPIDADGEDQVGLFFVSGHIMEDADPLITWFSWDHDGRW